MRYSRYSPQAAWQQEVVVTFTMIHVDKNMDQKQQLTHTCRTQHSSCIHTAHSNGLHLSNFATGTVPDTDTTDFRDGGLS
jgi:hypothetical protein